MKRVLILIVAVLALSACESGDLLIGTTTDIAFNPVHTQRGAMSQDDIDSRSVYIYATQDASALFENTAITRDTKTGKWFPAQKKQWVSGSSYKFYGYAYNTNSGLTLVNGKDGLEIEVQQPTTYNEANMIDYLLSHIYTVADGARRPIVQLHLEHAMAAVEVYVVRGNMFEARLKSIKFENIYTSAYMKNLEQAKANEGKSNVWQTTPSGNANVSYVFAPTDTTLIGDKRENTAAVMKLMCVPQQLGAEAKLTIEYEINEKVTPGSPDNYVSKSESFLLYKYDPMSYQSGHRIVYTATIDSGVNLEGVVKKWVDVDYIEGTVLPEIQ